MRRLIIVLVVLAMMLLIAVPLLADAGCWRALVSGGQWRGERKPDVPGAQHLYLKQINCQWPGPAG